MDSRSECHGTAALGLPCVHIESCIRWKPWSSAYGGCIPPRENFECKYQRVPWGGGDLIIQRYDRSDWRVGLLQCSHSLKGARQVRGQGRRGSATQEQSVSQKGGGLRGVPQYRRGGSTDREERDVDAKQQIVGPWAWQHHGTAEARLL
ncbi:hypothetical protein GW17_00028416 [Ensete ventricosum]|nr:hypothetical protein GW17_00028416 [Ensete ventricosum]